MTRDERDEQLGRGLRSSVEDELLIDDDGATANTTNIKRTSRYHIEDILRMREKDNIVLYFRYNKTWIRDNYSGIPLDAGEQPDVAGTAGDVMSIGGSKFLALKGTVFSARMHEEAQSGG